MSWQARAWAWRGGLALLALASVTSAVPIGVTSKKLIVVDKLTAAGKAKAVFVAKDGAITKGGSTDPDQISVQFDVAYGDGSAAGAFTLPAGASVNKSPGWVVNKDTVAKYVNKEAPDGPTEAKVAVIKPGKLLKLVVKGLGDTPLDILGAGDPGVGGVNTAYCVTNGGETNCHCSALTGCVYKSIAAGTGAKLVCKTGMGDPWCIAAGSTCLSTSGCFCDTGLTIIDTCNNLEWEKKNGADGTPGSGTVNGGNLHDVDNRYSWAGQCALNTSVFCQPNPSAAATCAAQTGGAFGCGECGVGDGACNVDPYSLGGITTIWDWVNAVNAASFAGHTDWQLATSAGSGGHPTGEPAELESIVDLGAPGCGGGSPCIDVIFGPTVAGSYWSGSSLSAYPDYGWSVLFGSGYVGDAGKWAALWVRAVRPGS